MAVDSLDAFAETLDWARLDAPIVQWGSIDLNSDVLKQLRNEVETMTHSNSIHTPNIGVDRWTHIRNDENRCATDAALEQIIFLHLRLLAGRGTT